MLRKCTTLERDPPLGGECSNQLPHKRSRIVACSLPWQPAPTTTELSRAAAAFRSSTRRPCSHSNTSSTACACTQNGQMSPLFRTYTLTTACFLESGFVVRCAIASSIGLRSSPWALRCKVCVYRTIPSDTRGTPVRSQRTLPHIPGQNR